MAVWKIVAVLTCISRANYCNDYFKCTVHFSFASLFCRLFGQTCLDGPLVGKMWVPHIVATPVSSFSGAHREHWSCRDPTIHTGYALTSTHPNLQHSSHSNSAYEKNINDLMRRRSVDLSVKANKNQGDYGDLSIQAAHSCGYGPVFIPSSGNKLIVLSRKNLEKGLVYSSSSPSGKLYSRVSPERDTQSLCVLLSFRRTQPGRKAVEYGTSVPVSLPHGMDAGPTPMLLGFQSWVYLLCAKRCLDLWLLPGQTALLLCHKTKTSTQEIGLPS